MRLLHGIERRLQGAVDKTFARIFGGSVQPAEVTSALQREAAGHVRHQHGRAIAPNKFIVQLGPSDSADVGDDMRRVSSAFTDMLANYVADQGWDTFAAVDVSLQESDLLHTGQFRITSLVDPDVGPRRATLAAAPGPMEQFFADASAAPYPPAIGGSPSVSTEYDAVPGRAPVAQVPPNQPYPQPPQPAPGYGFGYEYPSPYAAPPQPASYGANPPQPASYGANPPQPAFYAPDPPNAPQPHLVVDDGSGRSYPLRRGSNVIGRGQDAALRLADTSVSRQHIDVYFDGQAAIVHDLGSTNGTTVNGSPIQTWQLADGDVIRIGQSTVVFSLR